MAEGVSANPWLVQKYGGTSIGKLLDKITGTIIPDYQHSFNVAVVCSARSGTSKSRGTTSLILEALRFAIADENSTVGLDKTIDLIREEHLECAQSTLATQSDGPDNSERLLRLETELQNDCQGLRDFLHAAWTVGEMSDRTRDRALAVGETLSCRIVAASLESKGIRAQVVMLNDIVQESYALDTREQRAAFQQNPSQFLVGLLSSIKRKLQACNGKVPVVTGRGYTDLCAALCAASIAAQELQIWKEVDGIFTADPTKVPSARLLATMTSEEAAELTFFGSEVIHPLTVEQLGFASIPLRLKNTRNPVGNGTVIHPSSSGSSSSPSKENFRPSMGNSSYESRLGRSTPTAVTVKDNIWVINVLSNGVAKPKAFFNKVTDRLNHHEIAVDLISSSNKSISLAVCADISKKEMAFLLQAVTELEEIGKVTVSRKMAIVSVVGHRMRNKVSVVGDIFSTLADAKVNLYLISQGSSEINIS